MDEMFMCPQWLDYPALGHKKSTLFIAVAFLKNPLIVTWYTFRSIKIKTLAPKIFENETNDKFKLLGQNCNHRQERLKRKIVAL